MATQTAGDDMRRIYFLYICILLLAYCGGHQPTPVPAPVICGDGHCTPPTESHATCPADCPTTGEKFCGDGICGPNENSENCKRDCPPPPPVCDLDGKCEGPQETPSNCADCEIPQPDTCDPDNYKFEGCPKITRDHSRERLLGNYTGVFGQKNFNWSKYFKLFKKLTGQISHLLSPWSNMDEWGPFKKVGNQWSEEWDESWWTHYNNGMAAAEYYDVLWGVTATDQYCDPHCGFCKPEWYKLKTHPFQRVCGKGPGQTFYANWLRRLPVCDNAVLMCWDANDEENIDTYRATSKEGRMYMKFLNRLAEETAAFQKTHPRFRVIFRLANEAFYYVNGDNNSRGCGGLDHSRSKYLDDRSTIYFQEILKKNGFNFKRNARYIINEEFQVNGDYVDACWTDKTYQRYIVPNRFLYEFHGIDSVKDVEFFTKTLKMNSAFFFGSSDGVKEDSEYFKKMKEIDKLGLLWFDFKLWAGGDGPNANKMNEHVQYYVPLMEEKIFN
jgi:hypothetical protein